MKVSPQEVPMNVAQAAAKCVEAMTLGPEYGDMLYRDPIPTHRATVYISPKLTVKITRRGRPNGRDKSQQTCLLTVGRPNWHERERIKQFLKVGEPFPVKKVQLQFYPARKRA